ncbi:MAG: hypothetical protein NT154_29185 [Verrucomicrobia bacterium]|nr:hypothetical protein [Verrucomicrobiota bacterium]
MKKCKATYRTPLGLAVGIMSSLSVFSSDLVTTNGGLFPAERVVVVRTNGNKLFVAVSVTNTFREAVECRVYVMPDTNKAEVAMGPHTVAWSFVPPSDYGRRRVCPPPMAYRYLIGGKRRIGGAQVASVLIGAGIASPSVSLANNNVLVIQYYLPPFNEETALRSPQSLCRVISATIGERTVAEPDASRNAAEPRR